MLGREVQQSSWNLEEELLIQSWEGIRECFLEEATLAKVREELELVRNGGGESKYGDWKRETVTKLRATPLLLSWET